MAIGEIRLGDTTVAPQRTQSSPEQFGAGVSSALDQLGTATEALGGSRLSIAEATKRRQDKKAGFDAERDWINWSSEESVRQSQRAADVPEDGAGFTDLTEQEIEASGQEFVQTLPEHLRDQYTVKLAEFKKTNNLAAFEYEYNLGNEKFQADMQQLVNKWGTEIFAGKLSYEEGIAATDQMLEASDLPENSQRGIREQANAFFLTADFQQASKASIARKGYIASQPKEVRNFLGTIAKRESGGKFNVRYTPSGGATFESLAEHPKIYEPTADGRKSSAAGAFQITYETWAKVSKILNLQDFSEDSQIKAAMYLARERYNGVKPLGISLDEVLQRGQPEELLTIRNVLGELGNDKDPLWQAFETMDDDEFLSLMTGKEVVDFTQAPSLWDDPKYTDIPYDAKWSLTRTAETEISQQQTALTKQSSDQATANYNDTLMRARLGVLDENSRNQLIENGTLRTATEVNKFDAAVAEYRKENLTEKELVSALASGEGTLYQERHGAAFNKMAAQDDWNTKLRDMVPGHVENVLVPNVLTAGFIPSETAAQLANMVQGTDANRRAYALETLATLHAEGNYILKNSEGITDDVIKDVEFMQNAGKHFPTPQAALEALDFFRDPKNAPIIQSRREAGEKEFTASYPIKNLPDKLFDHVLAWEPNLPRTSTMLIQLEAESREAYLRGYEMYGSDAGALSHAKQAMSRDWGVTEINGTKTISKFIPEKFYKPNADIRQQVQEEIVRQGMPKDTPFELVAHENTGAEGEQWALNPATAGHNASYDIVLFDLEDRAWRMLSEDGSAWAFDGGVETLVDGTLVAHQLPEDVQNRADNRALAINEAGKAAALRSEWTKLEKEITVNEAEGNYSPEVIQAELARLETLGGEIKKADEVAEALGSGFGSPEEREGLEQLPLDELFDIIQATQEEFGGAELAAENDKYLRMLQIYWRRKLSGEASE